LNKIGRINNWVIESFHKTFGSKWFTFFVFACFVSQSLFYALVMAPFTPPDEIWHYTFIQEIASNPLYPFGYNTELLILYGLDFTGGLEYLYHFLLAIPTTVISRLFIDENLYMLRFINIFIVGVGLYFVRKLSIELLESRAYANFIVLILSGSMMFSALAGSVNYDNGVFALASASSYLLYVHIKKPTLKRLVVLFILSCMILMSKNAAIIFVIPVMLMAIFCFAAKTKRRGIFTVVKKDTVKMLKSRTGKAIAALVVLLVVITLESYGGNLVRYGQIKAGCVARYNLETCENYSWFYQRSQAMRNSGNQYDGDKLKFIDSWSDAMFKGVYGFVGHGRISHHEMVEPVAMAILAIAMLGFIRKADSRNLKKLLPFIIISGVYFMSLILFNFNTYRNLGGVLVAVQGRYLFPVLPLIYILMLYYIKALFGKTLEVVTISMVVLVSVLSIQSGVVWFKHKTTTSPNESSIINIELWRVLYEI